VVEITQSHEVSVMSVNSDSAEAQPTFEKSFAQLQELVKRLEGGALSLEDSLKAFEEGVRLTRFCQESLSAAEQKVEQLVKIGADGRPQTKPFEE
jgi:exodeoxyribonuclease VII small subunit